MTRRRRVPIADLADGDYDVVATTSAGVPTGWVRWRIRGGRIVVYRPLSWQSADEYLAFLAEKLDRGLWDDLSPIPPDQVAEARAAAAYLRRAKEDR